MSASENNDFTDDEFDLESNPDINPETVQQRLKEFTFYLVENLESNLNFCLQLLEERNVPSKPTSLHINALSVLCSAIPKLPGGVGKALQSGEAFIFRKIEKKNSRILADLVYYFSDNKEEFRSFIIDAALEVFSSFETQFMKLSCNGGEKRAMQKLARDAADRIFNYFLITEQSREVTKNEFIKGIINGDSKRNKIGIKEGKEVENNGIKLKTCHLYTKAGIVIIEPEKTRFYQKKDTEPTKYGYRKIFPWETVDETWKLEELSENPTYYLKINDQLKDTVSDYIMTKNQYENAKLERRIYNDEAQNDRAKKHIELLDILKIKFNTILNQMVTVVENITTRTVETKSILETVAKKQEEDSTKQSHIIIKLEEVHFDVKDTKEKQTHLEKNTQIIEQRITELKYTQEDMAVSIVKHEEIKEIVKDSAKEGVKELVKEPLRNIDPGKKVKETGEKLKETGEKLKEVGKKGEKEVKKGWDKFRKATKL